MIINVYTAHNKTLKYMKQKLTELKREIGNPQIIVVDFIPLILIIGRTTRQQISKVMEDLNNTIK